MPSSCTDLKPSPMVLDEEGDPCRRVVNQYGEVFLHKVRCDAQFSLMRTVEVCDLPLVHVGLHMSRNHVRWYGNVRFPADKRFK